MLLRNPAQFIPDLSVMQLSRQMLRCIMQIKHQHLFVSFLVCVIVSFLQAVIEVFCTSFIKCQIYLSPSCDRSILSR